MFEPDKITRNGGPSNGSAQKDTPLREASKPLMLQGKMWVIARAIRAIDGSGFPSFLVGSGPRHDPCPSARPGERGRDAGGGGRAASQRVAMRPAPPSGPAALEAAFRGARGQRSLGTPLNEGCWPTAAADDLRERSSREARCAVVARRRKECSEERSLLAELLPTRLTGAGDEPAETPKGERDQSMPGHHPKPGAAAGRLGAGQGAYGEGWIA